MSLLKLREAVEQYRRCGAGDLQANVAAAIRIGVAAVEFVDSIRASSSDVPETLAAIERADAAICDLAAGRTRLRMSIPPQDDDTDMVIANALRAAKRFIEQAGAATPALGDATAPKDGTQLIAQYVMRPRHLSKSGRTMTTRQRGCRLDIDGDGNCPVHPKGCPTIDAGDADRLTERCNAERCACGHFECQHGEWAGGGWVQECRHCACEMFTQGEQANR